MKQEASGAVVGAIRRVLAGELHLGRSIELLLMRRALSVAEVPRNEAVARLSDREIHVFEMLGAGLRTREIAERLGLSIKTIETHRENIKRKLELTDGAALVTRAAQWFEERRRE